MDKVKGFFARSRTILFARLYSFLGALIAFHDFALPYLVGSDWTPFFSKVPSYWLPIIFAGTGLLFEYLRNITKQSLKQKKENAKNKEVE